MKASLVQTLVSYGTRYYQEELRSFDSNILQKNWWAALDFFLNRASFQGRRDEISWRVYQEMHNVLAPEFALDSEGHNYVAHQQQNWAAIRERLQQ